MSLTELEIYHSTFNATEENFKFEPYIFLDWKSGDFSYEKLRDEMETDMEISVITATNFQDEIIGPIII